MSVLCESCNKNNWFVRTLTGDHLCWKCFVDGNKPAIDSLTENERVVDDFMSYLETED